PYLGLAGLAGFIGLAGADVAAALVPVAGRGGGAIARDNLRVGHAAARGGEQGREDGATQQQAMQGAAERIGRRHWLTSMLGRWEWGGDSLVRGAGVVL